MASVNINRGVDATDRADSVPREQWPDLLEARRDYCRSAIIGDCRLIVQFASDAELADWLGLGSRDRYLEEGLGLDPKMVEWALAGLQSLGVAAPVPLEKALASIGAPAGNTNALSPWKSTNNNPDNDKDCSSNDNNDSCSRSYGTSSDYVAARLDKIGRPDVAALVRSGAISANSAAIEAGFRKRPTGIQLLRAAWRKATADERATFLAEAEV